MGLLGVNKLEATTIIVPHETPLGTEGLTDLSHGLRRALSGALEADEIHLSTKEVMYPAFNAARDLPTDLLFCFAANMTPEMQHRLLEALKDKRFKLFRLFTLDEPSEDWIPQDIKNIPPNLNGMGCIPVQVENIFETLNPPDRGLHYATELAQQSVFLKAYGD